MDLPELLDLIVRYDAWVYGLLLAYCLGKTGPLPMLAGYAAAQGALQVEILLGVALLGTCLGSQLRFGVGRWLSPMLYQRLPRFAPWVALASAGVERYSLGVLLLYRFVKGSFSLVGVGAGASLITWQRFVWRDGAGAALWVFAVVGIGYGLGSLGTVFDPKWSAYVGLSLLVMSILGISLGSKALNKKLLPLAERILAARKSPSTTAPAV